MVLCCGLSHMPHATWDQISIVCNMILVMTWRCKQWHNYCAIHTIYYVRQFDSDCRIAAGSVRGLISHKYTIYTTCLQRVLHIVLTMQPPPRDATNYLLSNKVAGYMRRRFCYDAFPGCLPNSPLPLFDVSIEGNMAMLQLVSTLVEAYSNPGKWSYPGRNMNVLTSS